jgi:hypothetical protein
MSSKYKPIVLQAFILCIDILFKTYMLHDINVKLKLTI